MTRKPLLAVLTFALAWLAPLSAPAKDMRFPEQGVPAFAFVLPDDWIIQPAAEGNLILRNPNRSTAVVIILAASTEELDTVAKEAFATANATPIPRKEPAEISGCEGFTYFATMKNAQGDTVNVESTIVRVGAEHVAATSLLLFPAMTPAEETALRIVRNGIKLVRK